MDMRIRLFVHDGPNDTIDALREYARRRLSFAVRRFAHRISHITVRLVDVNGSRRGVDSRCSIAADLVDGGQLFVEATAAWPFAAITVASVRLSEALRREADRHAGRQRGSEGSSQRWREEPPWAS
jgi:ribosome-associated translation inhibitor RaiA